MRFSSLVLVIRGGPGRGLDQGTVQFNFVGIGLAGRETSVQITNQPIQGTSLSLVYRQGPCQTEGELLTATRPLTEQSTFEIGRYDNLGLAVQETYLWHFDKLEDFCPTKDCECE